MSVAMTATYTDMTDLYDVILATRKSSATQRRQDLRDMPALLQQAKAFLYGAHQGAMGSIDQGTPFVSAVNLVASNDSQVVLMVSKLAEHSRNLQANPACSILLTEAGAADIQESPRLTLVGEVAPLSVEQAGRYLRLFPHTASYLELDFYFLALRVQRARWIAGFGRAVWLEGDKLCGSLPWGDSTELDMVEHMNQDHADALRAYLALSGHEPASELTMAALDPWGLWLLADGKPVRVSFEVAATTPADIRKTLIALKEISPPGP